MLQYSERGAERTGELDRTEVGTSDDNRDVVAGRDQVEIDGLLDEHTGHGLVHVADEVEVNVEGPLRMHAHLEDNIIMARVMRDEFAGGTFVTAAMSDDMAAGLGLRCTAPLDVWVHGLVGMEERPGTCTADGASCSNLPARSTNASTIRARHAGTVVTTMKTGFRPLMKVALGVRNLIPGGGGGGGGASASPPAAPPAPGGGGGGEAAGAVTLTAVESGGAIGRVAAGGDDTDEIVSVVRTVESASDTEEVESLQHPASTADNLDELATVEIEGTGYQQVAEIYEQPVPPSAVPDPGGDELSAPVNQGESLRESQDLGGTGAHQLADIDDPHPLAPEQPGANPSAGSDSAAQGTAASRREPPPLDLTEPGTEGYDFRNAYGSLHERNQFYRQEMNLRGNMFTRESLAEIDARAFELFTDLDGSTGEISYDDFGLRTSSIYDNLEKMAGDAEMTGRLDNLADMDPEGVDEVQHASAANDGGSSGSPAARSDGTGGEDANPTGTVPEPGDSTTTPGRGDRTGTGPSGITPGTTDPVSTGAPRNAPGTDPTPGGASAADAGEGAAATRSDLYGEPVSFEGHSLEGAPRSHNPKELAQSLDGADIPVEDLPRVEPDAAEPRGNPFSRTPMADPFPTPTGTCTIG